MKEQIQQQLNLIEKSLRWVQDSLEDEKKQRAYRDLREFRRQLKRERNSIESIPAAAAYGESQVGKSYLMSSLLSRKGEPFTIKDQDGNVYNFKNDINPIGKGVESTSVVTRFTVNEEIEYPNFPIIANLLSPTDLILLICEAYYNNLNADTPPSFQKLNEKVEEISKKYENADSNLSFISEDDVLDMRDYFEENFSKLLFNNIKDAQFFEKVSLIVERIPITEWSTVFSVLWNESIGLTKLFSSLIEQFSKINFAQKVYLPMESVLRKYGTLLDVARLNEIFGEAKGDVTEYKPQVKLKYIHEGIVSETTFLKSFLCALISELVFVLPKEVADEKEFLNHTDLLDFPGTRRFEDAEEVRLNDEQLTILLRRGKVDYLFNKYSKDSKINCLLFCQNQNQSTVSVMPSKLDKWVRQMIGEDSKEREQFKTPVAPLFIISTWFNVDLKFDLNNDQPNNPKSLTGRWRRRFEDVLVGEILKPDQFPWFVNWKESQQKFQNIYLLRDFYESSDKESKVFRGYNEYGVEKEEDIPKEYPSFRRDLRDSFINYGFVKSHFKNPAESWDRAASINEDGTGLILQNLTVASISLNEARERKIWKEVQEIRKEFLQELERYYHSEDEDAELKKAQSTAGEIEWKMTIAFKGDDIALFGRMMAEFMVSEQLIYSEFRKKIHDIKTRQIKNEDIYSTIRLMVPELSPMLSKEENLHLLFKKFEKNTPELQAEYLKDLEKNKIDLDGLFNPVDERIKNFSTQLAEIVIESWVRDVKDTKNHIAHSVLTEGALEDVLEMFQRLFKKVNLVHIIAKRISIYVDRDDNIEPAYDMIADVAAEIINRFVLSVGLDYLDVAEILALKNKNNNNDLGLVFPEEVERKPISHRDIQELFTKIDNLPELLRDSSETQRTLPAFKNYYNWSNSLKIGFVSVCNIPNYDVAANAKLGRIIRDVETLSL